MTRHLLDINLAFSAKSTSFFRRGPPAVLNSELRRLSFVLPLPGGQSHFLGQAQAHRSSLSTKI